MKTYLLKPFPGTCLPEDRRTFNYRLSRARRTIENTFGIMASKFRIFRRPIIAKAEVVTLITQAACVLHNYFKISESRNPPSTRHYCPPGYADHENLQGIVTPGDWRNSQSTALTPLATSSGNRYSDSAGSLRLTLSKYFLSDGELPWQKDYLS